MKKPPAALKVVGPLKDKLELVKDTPLVLYEGNNYIMVVSQLAE